MISPAFFITLDKDVFLETLLKLFLTGEFIKTVELYAHR